MKRNRFLIGVTGNIGSGKSTVCSIIKKRGYPVVSCDEQTEKAYSLAENKLKKIFGEEIYEDGKINRKTLADMVFTDKNKIIQLNAVMHPLILEQVMAEAEKHEGIVFIEVPLLFECGFQPLFDEIWLVKSEKSTTVTRIKSRDNITEEDAVRRISSQIPDDKKTAQSHIIIHNVGTLDELIEKVAVELENLEERTKN